MCFLLCQYLICLNIMSSYTLSGLADENESVRDAALSAGHVLVEHYATTYMLLSCSSDANMLFPFYLI